MAVMQNGAPVFFIRAITAVVYVTFFASVFFLLPPACFTALLLVVLCWIACFEWPVLFAQQKLVGLLLFPLYPLMPFVLLLMLNHAPAYRSLVLLIFTLVSFFDTGAYIVGSWCGRHLIAPTLSARKTWEGVVGGFAAALLAMSFCIWCWSLSFSWVFMASFTGVVSIVSLAGDLFESWLKRCAKIKDSGTVLPGHGGFLDRLDGVLFVVVLVYALRGWLV